MIAIQLSGVGRLDFSICGVEGPLRAFENRRDHGPTVVVQVMSVVSHCDINPASARAAPTTMSTLRL